MQNLKENWLLLSKMTWWIWEVFTRALVSLKIGTLMGFFCPKLKMHQLNIYWGVRMKNVSWEWRMVQTLKRNWSLSSKLPWTIWQILIQALKNLKHFHFNGLPLTEVCNVWHKKVRSSYVWWHWILMQKLKENWLFLFKNDVRNLGNFRQTTWKSQNMDFGILLNRK